MMTSNKSNHDKLAKEFNALEEKNKTKRTKFSKEFDSLKKDTHIHQKRVDDRLNRFIPSRNR